MNNGISGFNDPLAHQPASHAIAKLANLIADLTNPARKGLLYESKPLLDHVNSLVTETKDNLYAWCQEYTPEMQITLTSSCNMVASLAPLIKYSPQTKLYPENVTQAITEKLDHLCLEFHRQLYQFFQPDYKLPASYIKMEALNAHIQYKRLLADHPGNLLLKAMLRPVHKLMYQPSANNTKERVDYITVLLSNLKLWHRKKGTQEQLYEIALAMNLNCPRVLKHMAGDASIRILKYKKSVDRLEYIGQLNKQFRNASANAQWKSSPHGCYLPYESPVGIYINEWLSHQSELASEEVKQIEEEPERTEMKEDSPFFAVLIRVMVTAGLTKLKKLAPVLRSFSRVISFSKSQNPSVGHLITLASSRISNTVLDKLEAFFEECLLIVRKIRRNGGKFPEDIVKEEKE